MLVLARQLRKMTQNEVCSKTQISQGLLSKVENGLKKSLPLEYLKSLSKLYDFPVSFFYREADLSPVSHLYFRRKLSLSAKIIDSFIAKSRIIKLTLDDLFDAVELPDYDLGSYNPSETPPQDIADIIRYKMKVYRGPVPNLVSLLENHGIVIFKMDFGTDKIDGLSTLTNKGYKVIFLNSNMPNDRIRFSLAHELGHMVMHMDYPATSVEEAEKQANAFAAQFLMPELEIKHMLYGLNISMLGELKRIWKVSMQSIIRRALDLGVITEQTRRGFQIRFSQEKWNKNEPIPLPLEVPSLISSTISLYKNELGYTNEDLQKIMGINQSDFSEWFAPLRSKIIPMAFPYH